MIDAKIDHPGSFYIYKEKVNNGSKVKLEEMSNIRQVVCSNCGYIEFYAEETQNFK